MMNYAVAISKDADMNNYSAVIPDVSGCYAFGDTIDELLYETKSAIESHIETTLDCGLAFDFTTTPLEVLQGDPDHANVIAWAFVSVDEMAFSKQVRFNVSWNEYLLKRVDEHIAKTHDTRSGFLAKIASEKLAMA